MLPVGLQQQEIVFKQSEYNVRAMKKAEKKQRRVSKDKDHFVLKKVEASGSNLGLVSRRGQATEKKGPS